MTLCHHCPNVALFGEVNARGQFCSTVCQKLHYGVPCDLYEIPPGIDTKKEGFDCSTDHLTSLFYNDVDFFDSMSVCVHYKKYFIYQPPQYMNTVAAVGTIAAFQDKDVFNKLTQRGQSPLYVLCRIGNFNLASLVIEGILSPGYIIKYDITNRDGSNMLHGLFWGFVGTGFSTKASPHSVLERVAIYDLLCRKFGAVQVNGLLQSENNAKETPAQYYFHEKGIFSRLTSLYEKNGPRYRVKQSFNQTLPLGSKMADHAHDALKQFSTLNEGPSPQSLYKLAKHTKVLLQYESSFKNDAPLLKSLEAIERDMATLV